MRSCSENCFYDELYGIAGEMIYTIYRDAGEERGYGEGKSALLAWINKKLP